MTKQSSRGTMGRRDEEQTRTMQTPHIKAETQQQKGTAAAVSVSHEELYYDLLTLPLQLWLLKDVLFAFGILIFF